MSLINKMLQDLDRRQALAGATDASVVQAMAPGAAQRGGREWLWRIVAVLLPLGVGWVIWWGYQLLPKPLVTNVALQPAPPPPAPKVTVTAPPPPPAAVAEPTPPGPVEAPPVTAPDTLRLAREIETPLRERAAAKRESPKQEPTRAPKLAAALPALPKGTVDKRDRVYSAAQTADAQFRRAAVLLNQGRLSEAEDHLAGALRADPSHAAARQTYAASLLEPPRVEAARRLLQEALAVNPAQPAFAVALARIYTEQRDYRNALEVLDKAGPAARNAEFQAMRGAVLQRLGQHPHGGAAHHNALRIAPSAGTTSVRLSISPETPGRTPDAAHAHPRALVPRSPADAAR